MPLKVVPRVPTKPVRNIYKGMESLESRALMAANVLTDLPDYLPGETAIISAWNDSESGADFTAGETVLFQVTRTDGLNDLPNGNLPWFVTDGVGGFDVTSSIATTMEAMTMGFFLTRMEQSTRLSGRLGLLKSSISNRLFC